MGVLFLAVAPRFSLFPSSFEHFITEMKSIQSPMPSPTLLNNSRYLCAHLPATKSLFFFLLPLSTTLCEKQNDERQNAPKSTVEPLDESNKAIMTAVQESNEYPSFEIHGLFQISVSVIFLKGRIVPHYFQELYSFIIGFGEATDSGRATR